MVPIDYRRLCPNAGRLLRRDEGSARARAAFCEACGRTVHVLPDPGSGRALLYAMHDRHADADEPLAAGSPS